MISSCEIKEAIPIFNLERKKKNAKCKNSGFMKILNLIEIQGPPSFIDFIQSGVQVNVAIGIDFTASNGNPNSPVSLHYPNQQTCLTQ